MGRHPAPMPGELGQVRERVGHKSHGRAVPVRRMAFSSVATGPAPIRRARTAPPSARSGLAWFPAGKPLLSKSLVT